MRPLLLVLSLVLLGTALATFFHEYSKRRHWRRATGTVVEIKKHFDGDDWMYTLSVSFLPHEAHATITFQDPVRSSGTSLRQGQAVAVLYNPTDPHSASIAGWRQHLGPAVLFFLAIVAYAAR